MRVPWGVFLISASPTVQTRLVCGGVAGGGGCPAVVARRGGPQHGCGGLCPWGWQAGPGPQQSRHASSTVRFSRSSNVMVMSFRARGSNGTID